MSIRAKLFLGFGVAALSSGLAGYISIQGVQEIAEHLQEHIPAAAKELDQASRLDGLAQLICYYDEVLTQSARNYAFTNDQKWADRYREHQPLRDKAIKHAIKDGDYLDKQFFSQVDEANLALVDMEYNSIALVQRGRSPEAIRVLESEEYWDQKRLYGNSLKDWVALKGIENNEAHATTAKTVLTATAFAKRNALSSVRSIWVLTAVLFAVAILAVFIVDRSITRPLNRLKDAAIEIGEGNFSICTEIRSNDEVGLLASSIEQMAKELDGTTTSLEKLNHEIAERQRVEYDQASLVHDMEERIKALTCMYGVAKVLRDWASLKEVFRETVRLIPPAWQYPHLARARIFFEDICFVSDGFVETEWMMSTDIPTGGQQSGVIEVFYTEEMPELDDGPFLDEERRLLDAIAATLGEVIERKLAEKAKDGLQAQLVHSEKLASVGQLSAGVAHEINNPMGFIFSNLGTMKKYLTRIKGHLESNGGQDSDEQREIIEIVADFGDAISESLEGAERVKKIVADLKGFARADSGKMETADLNTALESTLNIVWNQIKYNCKVEKDLGELPGVQCYRSQINQVLLNLLVNAGQAIGDGSGTIKIRTWADDTQCYISVKDDGCGIAQENLGKIFDPFFTTKDVGKGTGLGLSVSYEIVKNHGGRIDVDSVVGQGTEFMVSLPIEPSRMAVEGELVDALGG